MPGGQRAAHTESLPFRRTITQRPPAIANATISWIAGAISLMASVAGRDRSVECVRVRHRHSYDLSHDGRRFLMIARRAAAR
jgi:hypothetical protein